MSLPREILPGRSYMLTRRTVQRQFLLRPDEETNNNFIYCLALASERTGVEVILPSVMSNHHHTGLFDRHGTIVDFMTYLHRLFALSQNALRGRNENLWSSDGPNLLLLVDTADVLDKLVYAATNPVKAGLVERVHQWPGVNGLSALLRDEPLTATRPRHFFSAEGDLPERVTLRLVIPPELGDAEVVRATLRERVEQFEEAAIAERARTGARVLGRRAVQRQDWRATPTTVEVHGQLQPRVAARNVWSRLEALARNADFLAAYRDAWRRWRAGLPALFPAGTYWLRRFANVPVASPG